MDHRSLIVLPDGRLAVVGGMRDKQAVSDAVNIFELMLDQ